MRNFTFQPGELRVRRGTVATWVNCERADLDPHTTTSDDGAWSSEFLQPGASFSRRFDEPGRFEYHCIPHPFMRGTVVVE
jgi:plastocyanin